MKKDIVYEIDGIEGTIINYTSNHYVIGYAKGLRNSVITDDYEMGKMYAIRLLDWYKTEMEKINRNQFIYDKELHERTITLLENYVEN